MAASPLRLVAPVRSGSSLQPTDVLRAGAWLDHLERLFGPADRLFESYDIVHAYGIHPILLLLTGRSPFVAFEHGTMRELPFQDDWYGRLLSLAYRRAGKVIITNPDVVAAAHRLGLGAGDYVFIPHPVDETKYRPGPSELGQQLEAEGWDFVADLSLSPRLGRSRAATACCGRLPSSCGTTGRTPCCC